MTNNVDTSFADGRQGLIKAVLDALDAREKTGGGGSGGKGGGQLSNDWKDTVETRLGQLHSDIRMTFTALAGLVAVIIGLYVWVGYKSDNTLEKISNISEKAVVIETRNQGIENNIASIDRKIDGLGSKLDDLVKNNKLK